MGIKTISAGIASTLSGLVTDNKAKIIYEYSKTTTVGYPYIEIVPIGFENLYLTNQQNQIEYSFEIRIHHETTTENRGEANAQDDINQLIDDVVTLITTEQFSSTPLNGSCDFIRPSTTLSQKSLEEIPEILTILTLTAVKII